MAKKFQSVFQMEPFCQLRQVFFITIAAKTSGQVRRKIGSARDAESGIRVFPAHQCQSLQKDVKSLHRIGTAGSENPVFTARFILPVTSIEALAQSFIAKMVGNCRIDLLHRLPIPSGPADHMVQLFQRLDLQFAPLGMNLLLTGNAVMA